MIQIQDDSNKMALFTYGFRPFFLLAAGQAVVSIVLWVLSYVYYMNVIPWDSGSLWHGHEMIFGFALAVVAGFLLTAVPKWTGQVHLQGKPLVVLAIAWLLGRVGMLIGGQFAYLDILFIPLFIIALAPMLIRSKQIRNIAFIVLLSLLGIVNLMIHAEVAGIFDYGSDALLTAVFIITQMVVIIGGRVMPMFTRNALMQAGIKADVKQHKLVNILSLVSLPVVLVIGLALGFDNIVTQITASLFALAHFARLILWQGYKAVRLPIVWILHVSYLWVPLGLILLTFAGLTAALHAFTVGVISGMIMAMMSRVALGHTGRIILASKPTVVAYFVLQLSILVRVTASFVENYNLFILVSSIGFGFAFIFFLIAYFKILVHKSAS